MLNKKQKLGQKLGFSLIELSVVLLVIGFFIGLIAESSDILSESRLAAARSLTKTSPVTSNEGLILWLETTLSESFEDELKTGDLVSKWNDLGPYLEERNNALQSNGTYRPTFQENAINYIPAVRFDDTDDHLIINDFELRDTGTGQYAIFIVARKNNLGTRGDLISYKNLGNDNFGFYIENDNLTHYHLELNTTLIHNNLAGTITLDDSFRIFTFIRDLNDNNIGYVNSALDLSTLTPAINLSDIDNDTPLFIGSNHEDLSYDPISSFGGDIAEIIIYNKYVKASTRENIEEYLSKKYAININ